MIIHDLGLCKGVRTSMNREMRAEIQRVIKKALPLVMDEVLPFVFDQVMAQARQGRTNLADQMAYLSACRVVGVQPDDPLSLVEAVYKAKAKFIYPDNLKTGNTAAFQQLQAAYDRIKEFRHPPD